MDSRSIESFDSAGYLAGGKLQEGQDAYAKNAYNQKASEEAAFNREPPDVRHSQYVLGLFFKNKNGFLRIKVSAQC